MADESSRTTLDFIRLWLNAVLIPLVLAAGGLWQFYLKEVLWPATAINLSTEVTVKAVGLSGAAPADGKNLQAIELAVSARNPSASTIYLCENYWAAWGLSITAAKDGTEANKDWPQEMIQQINAKNPTLVIGGITSVMRPLWLRRTRYSKTPICGQTKKSPGVSSST